MRWKGWGQGCQSRTTGLKNHGTNSSGSMCGQVQTPGHWALQWTVWSLARRTCCEWAGCTRPRSWTANHGGNARSLTCSPEMRHCSPHIGRYQITDDHRRYQWSVAGETTPPSPNSEPSISCDSIFHVPIPYSRDNSASKKLKPMSISFLLHFIWSISVASKILLLYPLMPLCSKNVCKRWNQWLIAVQLAAIYA